MRRTLALGLTALTLVAGCGGSGTKQSLSTDSAAVLRASAGKTSAAGSSKLLLVTRTKIGGQEVTIDGEGAFAYAAKEGELTLTIGGVGAAGGTKIKERITGGDLYLEVPGQPGFYKIALADLVGTSLASSSDPTSSLQTLAGVSGPVTKVGTEDVRGAKTTHYRGTIDIDAALAKLDGIAKQLAETTFKNSEVKSLPFDAYVDDEGRMRKLVQNLTLTVKGQKADVETTIELFDFGTKVVVEAPPAAEVKDGSALLQAFKTASG